MPQVILQPASTEGPQKNYRETIETPVSLSRLAPYLTDQRLEDLREIYPEEEGWIWGAKPGKN